MKRYSVWPIGIALLMLMLTTGNAGGQNPAELPIHSLADVQRQFADPPAAYRLAPLYVWNDDMQEQEIAFQLDEFKKQGYGGVFVHPRPGLVTPYLSERWLNLWRFTAEEAQKRGMVTYIYDENSYPSGFAGGFVPDQMPETRQVFLRHNQYTPDNYKEIVVTPETIGLYRMDSTQGTYERIELPKVGTGQKITGDELKLEAGNYIHVYQRDGGTSPWYGGKTYVDLMNPRVTKAFLDITFGAYDKVLSDLYGKTVLACFTDEPQVEGDWSPLLPRAFSDRWGYDIADVLPSLFAPVGDWRKVRHDFAVTILELFMNNYARPYYEACEERGIPATGHVWEHGWPNMTHNPDVMSFNAWQHWPGIDCLMNQYSEGPNAQFGNYRSNKEIDSIANQFGRIRKLCETYGAAGWDLNFEDMKRIGDFLYAGGINLMNPHLSYYTIRGARKRDHPQSFSYHAPYWEAYHLSTDYFGRLSWALAAGKELNPILVIEPTTTMWMYNWSPSEADKLNQLGAAFQSYITDLGGAHVSFDLGSEPVMAEHAKIVDGLWMVGRCAYSVVVLPPGLENLEKSTVYLLNQFVEQGGTVISRVGVPAWVEGRPDNQVQRVKQKAGERWVEKDFPPAELEKTWGHANVNVRSTPVADGRVYHYLRDLDDGYLLFVSNSSPADSSRVEVTAQGALVEAWNPANGRTEAVSYTASASGGLQWNTELSPAGSVLYAVYQDKQSRPEGPAPDPIRQYSQANPVPPVDDLAVEPREPNVLLLDYADLVLKGEVTEGLYFYDAQTRIYKAYGFDKNPWDNSVQFKDELIKKDQFSADSGFELRYPFVLGDFTVMPALQLVVERGDRYTVKINDQVVKPEEGKWWLDRSFKVFTIKPEWLKKGRNVISTAAQPFSIHLEPEAVYLLGDFNLTSVEKGFQIDPPKPLQLGSWAKQGRPLYPGKVAYTRKFNCQKAASTAFFVELADWQGTVARVDVNGKLAGYIGWRPWRLEISGALQDGENTVTVTVFGSLKNLLGPHHHGKTRGSAWPGMFQHGAKGGQPAGEQYDVLDYGLNRPFTVSQAVYRIP